MVSANAIEVATGNLLLVIGVIGVLIGIATKIIIKNSEKKGKSVHKYWRYYGSKAIILGAILIIAGILKG